jgi:hypothetical protein
MPSAAPANPAATPAARALLDLLRTMETRRERRILSGQFTGFWNQLNATFPDEIQAQTGQRPALVGVDYSATRARRDRLLRTQPHRPSPTPVPVGW